MLKQRTNFGRNQYFKRKRGDILLPPEEQEVIRLMLEKVGADSKMDFDNYEEHVYPGMPDHAFTVPCQYHISGTAVSVNWYSSTTHIKLQYQLGGTKNGTEKGYHTSRADGNGRTSRLVMNLLHIPDGKRRLTDVPDSVPQRHNNHSIWVSEFNGHEMDN